MQTRHSWRATGPLGRQLLCCEVRGPHLPAAGVKCGWAAPAPSAGACLVDGPQPSPGQSLPVVRPRSHFHLETE